MPVTRSMTRSRAQALSWGRSVRGRASLLGPIRRNPRQYPVSYLPLRPQKRIFSLSNTRIKSGTDGYGWHLNAIPLGSSYNERHSDKIKITKLEFQMQFRDSKEGLQSADRHNFYLALVRDNSGGTQVPKFGAICSMDNSNIATAIIDHDNTDRFWIKSTTKRSMVGQCFYSDTVKYNAATNRVDFKRTYWINQVTEYKSATDGAYTNIQKNAWILYMLGQDYDLYVDGHVIVSFISLV